MSLTSGRKKRTAMALIFILVVVLMGQALFMGESAGAVSQEELNRLKEEASALAGQREELNDQLASIKNEKSEYMQRLNILNEQISTTKQRLKNLQDQMALCEVLIAEKEIELEAAVTEEQVQIELFKTRLRAMEENSTVTYISVLFSATSFADLLDRMEFIGEIMEYDKALEEKLRDARETVENAKAQLETEQDELSYTMEEVGYLAEELSSQQSDIQAVIATLDANSAEYEQAIGTINEVQSNLNSQISSMTAELNAIAQRQSSSSQPKVVSRPKIDTSTTFGNGKSTDTGLSIVAMAEEYLGVPYVWGGTSSKGFDCSGLVYYVYGQHGYKLNRVACDQYSNGYAIKKSELQPGDCVFFTSTYSSSIQHVGIYIGDGQFIHASSGRGYVTINNLTDSYYARNYYGANRILPD